MYLYISVNVPYSSVRMWRKRNSVKEVRRDTLIDTMTSQPIAPVQMTAGVGASGLTISEDDINPCGIFVHLQPRLQREGSVCLVGFPEEIDIIDIIARFRELGMQGMNLFIQIDGSLVGEEQTYAHTQSWKLDVTNFTPLGVIVEEIDGVGDKQVISLQENTRQFFVLGFDATHDHERMTIHRVTSPSSIVAPQPR